MNLVPGPARFLGCTANRIAKRCFAGSRGLQSMGGRKTDVRRLATPGVWTYSSELSGVGQPGGLVERVAGGRSGQRGNDHRKSASVGPAPRTGVPDPTRRRLDGPALKIAWPAVLTASTWLWGNAN